MKSVLTAAILAPALLLAEAAQPADYPVQRRHVVVRSAEPYPECFVGRYANMRYVPPLATHYWIRPVFISVPVPCDGR